MSHRAELHDYAESSTGSVQGELLLKKDTHQDDEIGGDSDRQTAVYNLLCTVMGGGILSLPYAMSQSGVALGVIFFFVLALYNAYTLELLFECGRIATKRWKGRTYGDGNIYEGDDTLNGEYTFYRANEDDKPVFHRKVNDALTVYLTYHATILTDEWIIVPDDPITIRAQDPLSKVRSDTIPVSAELVSKGETVDITNHHRKIMSYSRVGEEAYGHKGKVAAVLTLGLLSYFAIVVYFLFLSGVIPDVIRFARGMGEPEDEEGDFWVTDRFAFIATLVIAFPLASMRKINSLKYPSMIAVAALFVVVLVVVIEGIEFLASDEVWEFGEPNLAVLDFSIFRTIAVAAAANIVHVNGLTQFTELKRIDNTKCISASTMTITSCFYSAVGVLGYLQFTGNTEGNILVNYDSSNLLAFIGRLSLIWKLLLSIALVTFATRRSIVSYFWRDRNIRAIHEFAITCGILFTAFGFANLLGDVVELLLALLGGSLGALIGLVYPTMFYLKLKTGKVVDFKDKKYIIPSIVFFVSIVVGGICTVISILDFVEEYA